MSKVVYFIWKARTLLLWIGVAAVGTLIGKGILVPGFVLLFVLIFACCIGILYPPASERKRVSQLVEAEKTRTESEALSNTHQQPS